MSTATKQIRAVPNIGDGRERAQQEIYQEPWLSRWFVPRSGIKKMPEQEAKGVFVQWPLLIIIITLASILIGAIVGLQVQVSNLNTTLLLRDADHSRQVDGLRQDNAELKGKYEQLRVYIQDDREKLVAIQTRLGITRR